MREGSLAGSRALLIPEAKSNIVRMGMLCNKGTAFSNKVTLLVKT
jgi:hypothetical protein